MFTRLLKSRLVQLAAAWMAGWYLAVVLRTTRWTVEGGTYVAPFMVGGPVIVAFWHERLPLMPALWAEARHVHPDRRVAALASRHRDGRFIGSVLARFGVEIVYGSSAASKPGRNKGGAAGLRALMGALAQGDAVVITPDGPRGPRRVAAPGVAQLAAATQAPVLAASGQMRHRVILKTWDRMVLPLPFGRGAIVWLPPITVPEGEADAFLPVLESAMTQAADRADKLCQV